MKVKVTKLGFCDGLLPSIEELKAFQRLKEIISLLLEGRERTFSLDDPEDLKALKRLKEIVCLLLEKGKWTFSLKKPPVGDERLTSLWNVAREAEASPEDRRYWTELRINYRGQVLQSYIVVMQDATLSCARVFLPGIGGLETLDLNPVAMHAGLHGIVTGLHFQEQIHTDANAF